MNADAVPAPGNRKTDHGRPNSCPRPTLDGRLIIIMKEAPQPGSYPAQKCWQTAAAAAKYRQSRTPANFRRFHKEEAILNGWLDSLPPGALVLDVPCGAGRFVDTITRRGFSYLGADISLAMIDEAKQQAHSSLVEGFIHADAARLPLPDQEVDCVIIWRLLHHVRDPANRLAILREAARVSRARVIVSFHHPFSFTAIRKALRRALLGKGSGTEFTQWQLRREAQACGLELIETKGFRKYISINWFACLVKKPSLGERPGSCHGPARSSLAQELPRSLP